MPSLSQKKKIWSLSSTKPFPGCRRQIQKRRIKTLDFQGVFFNCCYGSFPPCVFHRNVYICVWRLDSDSPSALSFSGVHQGHCHTHDVCVLSKERFPTQGRTKGKYLYFKVNSTGIKSLRSLKSPNMTQKHIKASLQGLELASFLW